jgi:hypothetical protein
MTMNENLAELAELTIRDGEVEIMNGQPYVSLSYLLTASTALGAAALKADLLAEESGDVPSQLITLGQMKMAVLYQTVINSLGDKAELEVL